MKTHLPFVVGLTLTLASILPKPALAQEKISPGLPL
jgi:hypothetical protein